MWLVFHYFLRRQGEWGPEPHELEPWWLALHGAFAFAALWTLGLLWGVHVVRAWATGRRRWTGLALSVWLGLLVLTALFLIYGTDDGPWRLMSLSHWIAGLALPIAYFAHRWLRARMAPAR